MTPFSILVISEFYYPDPSAGQRVSEMLGLLAARGHHVTVLASRSRYLETGSAPERSPENGVAVERIWSPVRSNIGLAAKGASAAAFELAATIRALFRREPFDMLITVSTPPLAHVLGVTIARMRKARHVFWCADVHPELAIRLGMLRQGSAISRVLQGLNRWALRRCDAVVAVGRCMRQVLIGSGALPNRVLTIPMWQRDEIGKAPSRTEVTVLTNELGLSGQFVAMYSGNLGRVHQFDTLLQAATRLTDDPGISFLISGGGPGIASIREYQRMRGLQRLQVHALFPENRLAAALALAGVHLITLAPQMSGISVPGKLYGAMASGRPVVFIGPDDSEVAQTIREEDCGFVVAPGDVAGLVSVIRRLKRDSGLSEALGARGRQAFLNRHCLSKRGAEWVELVESDSGGARNV